MIEWLKENSTWLSFALMAVLGALIGHVKAFQSMGRPRSTRWHLYSISVKVLYSIFISLIIYFAHTYFGWKEQISFILTGVCSVFSDRFVDKLWATMIRQYDAYTGALDNRFDRRRTDKRDDRFL